MKKTRTTQKTAGDCVGHVTGSRTVKAKKPSLKSLCLVAETLATASPERFGCQECKLHKKAKQKYQRPFVPKGWTKKVLVVTTNQESPTTDNGRLILRHARKAGLKAIDVAFTAAIRCTLKTPKKKHGMIQLRACRSYVVQVIDKLAPTNVLAFGQDAIRSVLNDGAPGKIIAGRGRKYPVPGTTAVAYITFEPDTSPDLWPRIVEDFQRLDWPVTPWPKDALPNANTVALDTEFSSDGTILNLALADRESAGCITADEWPRSMATREALARAEFLAGHSVMCDVDHAVKLGVCKEGWADGSRTRDSLLLARMSDENRGKGGYGVEALLLSGHNAEPWKYKTEEYSKEDATTWPAELRAERCRLDAWASAIVADDFKELARGPIELTHRIGAALHRIGLAGAYVELAEFEKIASATELEVTQKRELLTRAAQGLGMLEFTPTNDNHIRELLFDRLKLPATEKTERGQLKVDKLSLKAHADNEIVKNLQAFNKADKVFTTYIEGVRRIMSIVPAPWGEGNIGYFPVNINPLGARTGRRSSGSNEDLGIDSTNFQNWPKPMRRIIRSRWKGGLIGDHDYSRLEVLLFAWHAGEEDLFKFFYDGNGYIAVAKELFRTDVQEGTDQYRATKSTVLGVQYNMQDWKLANQLWNVAGVKLSSDWDTHCERAAEIRQKYLDRFPGIKRYIRARTKELLAHGYVESKTGRRRHLPCPDGEETPHFWHLKNEAVNFPVQSFASDVTGSALVDIESALCAEHRITRVEYHKALLEKRWPEMAIIFNEVHDDIVVDYFPDTFKRDQEIVVETMRKVPTLRKLVPDFDLPLKVGVEAAPLWCAGKAA